MNVPQENGNFVRACAVAAAIVVGVALFPLTRKYATWLGLLFLTILFLRYRRTGGQ